MAQVLENHDRLFLDNIFASPHGNASLNQRWIDNYAYRLAGGVVHARNFRFGGEDGGFPAVVNWAPYACTVEPSPFNNKLQICAGGPPRRGAAAAAAPAATAASTDLAEPPPSPVGLAKGSSTISVNK